MSDGSVEAAPDRMRHWGQEQRNKTGSPCSEIYQCGNTQRNVQAKRRVSWGWMVPKVGANPHISIPGAAGAAGPAVGLEWGGQL